MSARNTCVGLPPARRALLLERAMLRTSKDEDGCWRWTGILTGPGYGQFAIAHATLAIAHRAVYELLVGPIPDGLELDHACRVRNCVNPDHLEPVSRQENLRRSRRTHCKYGHEFTAENTYMQPKGKQCKTCGRIAARVKYREKHGIPQDAPVRGASDDGGQRGRG